MIAAFGGVTVAAGGLEGVSGLAIDGRQVNQESQLLRTNFAKLSNAARGSGVC